MFKFNTDTIERLKAVDKRYWAMGLAAGVVAVGLFFVCANQITLTDEALSKKEITFNVPPGTPHPAQHRRLQSEPPDPH